MWAASAVGDDAQTAVLDQVGALMGEQARETADASISNAQSRPSLGSLSAVVGVLALPFAATGIFAQLRQTLNRIWEVEPKPGSGLRHFLRTRVTSAGMVAALGFLLMVSLAVLAAVAFVFSHLGSQATAGSLVSSVLVSAVAFSAVYKTVPDCVIRSKDAVLGGVITAVLFALGKEAIGLYIGRGAVGSAYGAAGSLLVLLVWVYDSSLVTLFRAELTQVYDVEFGGESSPTPTRSEPKATRLASGERGKRSADRVSEPVFGKPPRGLR